MQFLRIAAFAAISAVTVSAASLAARNIDPSACATGASQCCQYTSNDNATKTTVSNLSGFDALEGLVGFGCDQVPVQAGAAQNACKQTSVCCSHVTNDGLFAVGCTPASVN